MRVILSSRGFVSIYCIVIKYYKKIENKHGNDIHWNGIEHYQEDFTKFNQLIKQMNVEHQEEK